ncbi:LPS export ABC transporter periplasmic protein LptC [Rhodoblastus sp.]|uniref:LPS export ABC transporter periplasmic protein LptC n=1 Tax=Rhodoblastus sp. TaxID=1962975 RepID=UPI003F9B54D3
MTREDDGRTGEDLYAASPRRVGAFREAARHSARVRTLRRAILIGAAAATFGLVWYSWFRAENMGEVHLSLESLGISSDKITMAHPRMTGLRRDGKPYDVIAETGVQSPKNPNRTVLTKLNAKLYMADGGETRILGDAGVYDSAAQTLALSGNVRIKGTNFTLSLRKMKMDFKANIFSSDEPVRLELDNGWVEANGMASSDNGDEITFSGDVKSQFSRPAQPQPPAPELKESTP